MTLDYYEVINVRMLEKEKLLKISSKLPIDTK